MAEVASGMLTFIGLSDGGPVAAGANAAGRIVDIKRMVGGGDGFGRTGGDNVAGLAIFI